MEVDTKKCLAVAVQAAKAATRVISQFEIKGLTIRDKGNDLRDLITEADTTSEKLIRNNLNSKFPNFAILGEEFSKVGDDINPEIPTWIIDPLDGTTNFASGIPLYAVSIALWLNGQPLIGVVCEVPTGRMFHAVKGKGAWLNNQKLQVSLCDNIQDSSIAYDWPFKDELRATIEPVIINSMRTTRNLRILGSAVLALCYVAAGVFDGYFNVQLYPWDVAAAKLFIEEAGGKLTDKHGNPWLPSNHSIVATNGLIHGELVKEFAK
ncbi:inositol monophosphatase [Candidatus Parcubacteria bacterium]|nr:inositol monophosphatase [Candidatus Parcubacteria bacterium]